MFTSALLLASLVSAAYAQCDSFNCNNNGSNWNGGYSAGVAIAVAALLVISLCFCAIGRRRSYARRQNPHVKPPMFGSAPAGYTLPIWNNDRFPAPPYEARNGNNENIGLGTRNEGTNGLANGGIGGMQYPPPMTSAPSDPPPPSYGKAVHGTEPYAPPPGPPPMNKAGNSYSPPLGAPPQAHTTGENGHFVGGFRQQQ